MFRGNYSHRRISSRTSSVLSEGYTMFGFFEHFIFIFELINLYKQEIKNCIQS